MFIGFFLAFYRVFLAHAEEMANLVHLETLGLPDPQVPLAPLALVE